MLIKSMELSLKQIGEPMGISIAAGVFMVITAMLGGSAGAVLMLGSVLVMLIAVFAGYTKLFGSSLFGEDGGLSMTLPLAPAELIGGRLLAAVVWCMTLCIVVAGLLGLMAVSIGSGLGGVYQALEQTAAQYMASGASPLQVGLLTGLLPLGICVSAVFMGMWMLAFQCLSHQRKEDGKGSFFGRFGVKTAAAAAIALYGLFNRGTNWLLEAVAGRALGTFWIQAALIGLQILLIVILYRFCRNAFSRRCDFG